MISSRTWSASLVVALALLASARTPVAQAQESRVRGVEVRAGYVRATIDTRIGQTDHTNGWTAGIGLPIRLDEAIAVVPELLYARKGGQFSVLRSIGNQEYVANTRYDLDYLEAAALVRFSLPLSRTFGTRVGAGAYVARILSRGTESELDLDNEELELITSDAFQSEDLGLTARAEIAVPILGRQRLLLGARIDYGLLDLLEEEGGGDFAPPAAERRFETRALLFTVGLRF